jgi:hypothetical protein
MTDFSQDIQNFQRYGTYIYKFDDTGNLIFNSSSTDFSQVYLAFPIFNITYDNSKINTFYDTNFTEFIPTPTGSVITSDNIDNLQEQLDTVQQENESLKNQLDNIIIQNENNNSVADQMATKQVILELRKTLGQGRVESDFSNTFPYTPIRKPTI